MDIIFLRGLRIETVLGLYEWERTRKRPILIDLEMGADIRKAAADDDIAHTIDYGAVSERIIRFVEGSQFLLVETLAERIAAILIEEFGIRWVRVTANKIGAIGEASDVGVIIERRREPGHA